MPVLPQRNLLGNETSPYLRQHADNPVFWRPWSRLALDEAVALGRPILLSVGYAACHWCHVMAHESFADQAVADVMNQRFVNIKVDREERPDIDQIYMSALQAMGEQGGWPLTMFLTPDAMPIWGGTYFPKQARHGRPGFISVLDAVANTWEERSAELKRSASVLHSHVAAQLSPAGGGGSNQIPLRNYADAIYSMIDMEKGGLRGAPKFPNSPMMMILRLSQLEHGAISHGDAVINSLRHMLAGGIYDHIGGGMCRYATDADWLLPHFEKMLYDNAQLIDLAGWAYAQTGEESFRKRIEETVDWLCREMVTQEGGFASSLNADTEGQEGLFYLWGEDEIADILGEHDTTGFFELYQLTKPEHWEGNPILHQRGMQPFAGADQRLAAIKMRLLNERSRRERPLRDDKVLVDWNGMMICALVRAARQFDQEDWLRLAISAYRFVNESLVDGRLPHSISDGKALFPGLSSDYAAMILASVGLYEATSQSSYLDIANRLLASLDQWHGDDSGTGYFLTARDSTDIPMRIRGDVDEAMPSATSQIITAMTRLAIAQSDQDLYQRAMTVAGQAARRVARQRHGQAGIIHAASIAEAPIKLLLVSELDGELVSVANRYPDPRRTDIRLPPTSGSESFMLPDGTMIATDRPGAWLCLGQTCLAPIRYAAELDARLRQND